MKKIYSPQWLALIVLVLCIFLLSRTVNAQWSEANILFEDFAQPATVDEVASPLVNVEKDMNGTLHLIWSNKTAGGTRLAYSTKANGLWSEIVNFPEIDYNYSVWPSTAIGNDGTIHCTWTVVDDQEYYYVMYAHKDPDSQWSNPLLISDDTYFHCAYSQLFIDDQNQPHIIYNAFVLDGQFSTCELKHVMIHPTTRIVTELPAPVSETMKAFNPRVGIDDNGTVHCLWYDNLNSQIALYSSTFDGSSWSENEIIATHNDSYFMDESPIVLINTPGEGFMAMWLSLDPETGQYSNYQPLTGWGVVKAIDDPSFRMAAGIGDTKGYIHATGSNHDMVNGNFDFRYHFYNNAEWIHEVIEPSSGATTPGLADLIIQGDTLWCYYVRYEGMNSKLAERYRILDYLTPVKQIPMNKEIRLTVSPNPVSSSSELTFSLKEPGEVTFILSNGLGQMQSSSIKIADTGIIRLKLESLFDINPHSGAMILKIITREGIDTVKILNI